MPVARDPWEALREDYRTSGLSLCLGAGVSLGCGLPSWKQLLERLAEQFFPAGTRDALLAAAPAADGVSSSTPLVDSLASLGFSLPAVASLIQQSCAAENQGDARDRFLRSIADALYGALHAHFPGLRDGEPQAKRQLAQWIGEANPTLAALAALCAQPRPGTSGFLRNPNIHAVVNFNLDGLFRRYVRAYYGRPGGFALLRTIERANKEAGLDQIRYYHAHGYIPIAEGSDDARDLVVFTEQDYFDFFNRPTGIFTYTLLSLLRESSVLFVGLSFADDNLRRLLHYSRSERVEHALRERGANRDKAVREATRHYAVLGSRGEAIDALTRQSLFELGVTPLFVGSFDELPGRLGRVYGGDWSRVYRPALA